MLRYLSRQRGGIGTYTVNLLRHLLSIDRINQYYFLYRDDESIGTYDSYPNVEEVVLAAANDLYWDQYVVPRFAAREGIDVLFNPKMTVPLWTDCKTVFVEHGADWLVFPQNYNAIDRIYHRIAAPLYFRKGAAIITVSKDAARHIEAHMPCVRGKLATIYHACNDSFHQIHDTERLAAFRDRYGLPAHYLLYVGQIYPMKNFAGILKAYTIAKDRIPHNLVIVGKPSIKYKEELEFIRTLDIEGRVQMMGWVPSEDLPLFYNLAGALVFPSFYEGFGIPILEAMACGCPVITSTEGSCPEVAGDAALLVDPNNHDAIADAIFRAATDGTLRADLTRKGLARATEFSWERCARETLEVLESVTGSCKVAQSTGVL